MFAYFKSLKTIKTTKGGVSQKSKKLSLGIPDISHLVENGHAIHDLKAERVCFCMSQLKQASSGGTTSCVPGYYRGETTFWKFVDHSFLLLKLFTYFLVFASGIHDHFCNKIVQ